MNSFGWRVDTAAKEPLPRRIANKPETSVSGPHQQLSDKSPPDIWGRLIFRSLQLEHVIEGRSSVSPVASRALLFDDKREIISSETSLSASSPLEPVHIHGILDTSIHLCISRSRALEVCQNGWGEPHAFADNETEVMIYGPRDNEELEVVMKLIEESLTFARNNN